MVRCWGLPQAQQWSSCVLWAIPSTFQPSAYPCSQWCAWCSQWWAPDFKSPSVLCLTFHTRKMKIVVQLDIYCKSTGTDKIFIISVTTMANAMSKWKCIYSGFVVLRMQKGSQEPSLGEITEDLMCYLIYYSTLSYKTVQENSIICQSNATKKFPG